MTNELRSAKVKYTVTVSVAAGSASCDGRQNSGQGTVHSRMMMVVYHDDQVAG